MFFKYMYVKYFFLIQNYIVLFFKYVYFLNMQIVVGMEDDDVEEMVMVNRRVFYVVSIIDGVKSIID